MRSASCIDVTMTIAHAAIHSFLHFDVEPQDETKPPTGWHVANVPAGEQSLISIRGMPSIQNRVCLPIDGEKNHQS
jgi:hypothetical protein